MNTKVKFTIIARNNQLFYIDDVISEEIRKEIRIPNIGEEYTLCLYRYLDSFTNKKEIVNKIFPRDEGESFKEYKTRLEKACQAYYMVNTYESFLNSITQFTDRKLFKVSRIKHWLDIKDQSDDITIYLEEIPNKQYWE